MRDLPGSGAQGSIIGNWEYLSQTNNNADSIPNTDRWKWVDDLTSIEIVNLICVGLSSYNFKQHVASDIPIHGHFIDPQNLKRQKYINEINSWLNSQKMILNEPKMKSMLVNFTRKYQFSTRMKLNNTNIQQVDSVKILGTILSDNLTWNENSKAITKNAT